MKLNTDVVRYGKLHSSHEIMGTANISSASVTNTDKSQGHLDEANLSIGPCADLSFIDAVAVYIDRFQLRYTYAFYFTSMNKVVETLENVFTCIFYASETHAIKLVGKKSTDSSL